MTSPQPTSTEPRPPWRRWGFRGLVAVSGVLFLAFALTFSISKTHEIQDVYPRPVLALVGGFFDNPKWVFVIAGSGVLLAWAFIGLLAFWEHRSRRREAEEA